GNKDINSPCFHTLFSREQGMETRTIYILLYTDAFWSSFCLLMLSIVHLYSDSRSAMATPAAGISPAI
ncbi:MAG: hypothetical protein KME55_33970, partial [Nostoc indistinguendum CM1-VF10]|nr:hypothetical protein [Nostoc indistinguendum CM1-VF10]